VKEGSNNEVVYKNNLDNYVYAVINEEYEYDNGSGFSTGVSNIFIAFDEDGKIAKIDGDVTNTVNFPLANYLAQFVGLDAATLAGNPNPADIDIDGVSQATWTTNAVYDAVVKNCQFYLAGE
ncbi:MAG TPA: FMN-binding protein, partial [Clostridia bacterium]